jgi:hypothetical protein
VKWLETDFLRGHSLTTSIVHLAPKRNRATRTARVDAVETIKFLAAELFYAVFLLRDSVDGLDWAGLRCWLGVTLSYSPCGIVDYATGSYGVLTSNQKSRPRRIVETASGADATFFRRGKSLYFFPLCRLLQGRSLAFGFDALIECSFESGGSVTLRSLFDQMMPRGVPLLHLCY